MIPDFKTFIGESAWGEMRHRGSGKTVRKEDDINLLDKDGFADYINDRYLLLSGFNVDIKETMLCVPFVCPPDAGGWAFNLTLNYPELYITLSDDFNDYYPELYHKLQQEFLVKLEQRNFTSIVIYSKQGKTTNQVFIDVLDFIIENIDEKEDLQIKKR